MSSIKLDGKEPFKSQSLIVHQEPPKNIFTIVASVFAALALISAIAALTLGLMPEYKNIAIIMTAPLALSLLGFCSTCGFFYLKLPLQSATLPKNDVKPSISKKKDTKKDDLSTGGAREDKIDTSSVEAAKRDFFNLSASQLTTRYGDMIAKTCIETLLLAELKNCFTNFLEQLTTCKLTQEEIMTQMIVMQELSSVKDQINTSNYLESINRFFKTLIKHPRKEQILLFREIRPSLIALYNFLLKIAVHTGGAGFVKIKSKDSEPTEILIPYFTAAVESTVIPKYFQGEWQESRTNTIELELTSPEKSFWSQWSQYSFHLTHPSSIFELIKSEELLGILNFADMHSVSTVKFHCLRSLFFQHSYSKVDFQNLKCIIEYAIEHQDDQLAQLCYGALQDPTHYGGRFSGSISEESERKQNLNSYAPPLRTSIENNFNWVKSKVLESLRLFQGIGQSLTSEGLQLEYNARLFSYDRSKPLDFVQIHFDWIKRQPINF